MANEIDYELLALFDDMAALSDLEVKSLDEIIMSLNSFEEPPKPSVHHEQVTQDQSVPVNDQTKNDRREPEGVFAVPKIYTCMYCYKRFYSQSAIRRHQVYHAKRQLQCPCCKKKSYNVHILRRHYEYFHVYAKHQHVLIQA